MATFVLIPGAGTDPRVYTTTIGMLGELGHDALAPALPLDDPAATPADHADAVIGALPEGREIIVAAHSLGAFAGPLVAARTNASRLILVAPMIPAPGESAGEWWSNTHHAAVIPEMLERHGATSEWGPEAITEVFLHDVDPAVARESERYAGAPGAGMFGEPWPLQAWPDVPTHVLIPREDRFFPLDFQKRVSQERLGLEIDEMAGGHVPMLSRPRELAERLTQLAQHA
jgi:alpha/beta hydrolase family protein